jgi:RNA polymerase sigma-70 factor, ECF subfamily
VSRPTKNLNESRKELVSPELVERCKRGDERAWAELVELTHREVYTLCLRILRHPQDASEATQDAYLKAWRGLGGFRGEAMFTTWLYRVATNAAISKQRSRKRRFEHETGGDDDVLAELSSGASTEDTAGARLELARLQEALDSLPEHYRTSILLRDVYGLSMEEIAHELGISVTAAKVRVHRSRKKIKELMFQEDVG